MPHSAISTSSQRPFAITSAIVTIPAPSPVNSAKYIFGRNRNVSATTPM
jgi:hypothetical protein